MVETLIAAAEQVETVQPDGPGIEEVVGDKGYHSNATLVDLKALGLLRSYLSEPDRGRRCWKGRTATRDAVYANPLLSHIFSTTAASGDVGSPVARAS